MKRLIFDNKANNNKRREREFLALSPGERLELFLKMVDEYAQFPTRKPIEDKGNFVIDKKNNAV